MSYKIGDKVVLVSHPQTYKSSPSPGHTANLLKGDLKGGALLYIYRYYAPYTRLAKLVYDV